MITMATMPKPMLARRLAAPSTAPWPFAGVPLPLGWALLVLLGVAFFVAVATTFGSAKTSSTIYNEPTRSFIASVTHMHHTVLEHDI